MHEYCLIFEIARTVIREVKKYERVKCVEDEAWHYSLPLFSNPECGIPVEILESRERIVKNVHLVLSEENSEEGATCLN